MSLRIQPTGGRRGTPRGRAGSGPVPEALLQELADLREAVDALRQELAHVRAQHADVQRQTAELKEQATAQAGRTSALAEDLHRGATTLAIVNRALTALREQTETHQQAMTAAWLEQQQQARLALERIETRGERARNAIESLEAAENHARQLLERHLDAIRALIEQTSTHLARELAAVSSGLNHLEQLEQAAQTRLGPAIDVVRQQFHVLTQALAGIEAATTSILRQNERVAAAHDAAEHAAALAQARRLNRLGLESLAARDPALAAHYFEEACRLAPEPPEPRFNLALARFQQGEYTRATTALEALPADIARLPETQFLHGLIELAGGNPAAARQRLSQIEGTLTDNPALQSAAGLASLLSHDAAGAVAAFQRAIRAATPAGSTPPLLEVLATPSNPPANPGAHD